MIFLANDVRAIMAALGFRTIDEMVGSSDMLEVDKKSLNWKSKYINFSKILGKGLAENHSLNQCCSIEQNHQLESVLDRTLIKDTLEAVETQSKITHSYNIKNTDRAVGAMLSNEIAKRYGMKGLDEDTITLKFDGHAGQSFGAFLSHGVSMEVRGDANDYVGKGLSGGVLSFYPHDDIDFKPEENTIVGSVVLYGAITGKSFFRGRAAERFCIRNSGAKVVVEGVGAHACEYMTGGRVVILGSVEHNFASGMSGGIAYVWDKDKSLKKNTSNTVEIHTLNSDDVGGY